jgi:hypothetical protein
MRRKLWIRLVGLLSLFGWGVTCALFWASTSAPDATTRSNVDIITFVIFAGAFLLTVLWTVLSIAESLEHSSRLSLPGRLH